MISYPNVKINLGLRVLRRRSDGYHDLETLFVPCGSLHDTLSIEEAEEFSFEGRIDWPVEKELTVRAYGMLREEFGIPPVKIRLEKGAPVGAGLGGGSADAAFALKMLSEMFSLGLSEEELARRAALLGSDCPFFIYNRPMFGEGRGEILSPFDIDLSGYDIRLFIPEGISVSTADAYRGIRPYENCTAAGALTGPSGTAHIPAGCNPAPLRNVLSLPVEQWRGTLVNDFEPTVFAVHPRLASLKEEIYAQGAVYAAMSGSGSTLFGLFKK